MTATMTLAFEIADNGVLAPSDPHNAKMPQERLLRVLDVPTGTPIRDVESRIRDRRLLSSERRAIFFDELF